MTTSSWSCTPLEPFGFVTPTTWKLVPPMRSDWPTGSCVPKRFATTVGPRTATRVWWETSDPVIIRPEPTW